MSIAEQINAAEAAGKLLTPRWKTLRQRNPTCLDVAPPPREMLLRWLNDGHGALAKGIVSMLVAMGGRGKSMLLCQLAVAAATESNWIDTFKAERPCRVLLALAEEEDGEIDRRVYEAAQLLTPAQRELALDNITAIGLAGTPVQLVQTDGGTVVKTTEVFDELHTLLSAQPYDLVILDPLARFAPDVESSNAAATAAIQALERLTQTPGRPTVIIAHHTAKWARRDSGSGGTAGARGVTGLTDAVRLVWCIEGMTAADLALAVTKSNYTKHGDPVPLVRDESNGLLRPPTSNEMDMRKVVNAQAAAELRERVAATVRKHPGIGATALRDAIKGRGTEVVDMAKEMVRDDVLRTEGKAPRLRYYVAEVATQAEVSA